MPKDITEFLGAKWITNRVDGNSGKYDATWIDTLTLSPSTEGLNFCVQCYFILRVENKDDNDYIIRLIASQDDESGSGFYSHLVLGKPTTVKLEDGQKAQLAFNLGGDATEDFSYTLNA